MRDVEHGEMIVISDTGLNSSRPRPEPGGPCVFGASYFARPEQRRERRSVYGVRKRMGMRLAEETPASADVVVPVPDSGVPAALGYARSQRHPL